MNLAKLLTPTNLAQEKVKFFNSTHYHPQFIYSRYTQEEINLWLSKKPHLAVLKDAIDNQNDEVITSIATSIFGAAIEEEPLTIAKQATQQIPEKITPQSTEKIERAFASAFSLLELDYSLVITDEHGYNFRPKYSKKELHMSLYAQFEFFSIDGEIKHELLHIIRHENNVFNGYKRDHHYLHTEEGLACYFQDTYGDRGNSSLFQHAAEYLVTEVCLDGSLRDAVEFLQELGFSKELAWQRASRHKFGFHDTSLPGDIMKPSMYFYNEFRVQQLTDDERYRLLSGKLHYDSLKDVSAYKGKFSRDKLEIFFTSRFWER